MREKPPEERAQHSAMRVEQVLTRMPFTLAAGVDAPFPGNSVTRGFRCMPVTFTPGERSAT